MMRELRTKAVVHESCPEGALVYRKPSCRRVDPRRDRRRRWSLALSPGAGVRRCDGAVGMRYVRARRLSEATRALADGAPDILGVALDADYGSHEAFTRAFRDHFGVAPETVRSSTRLDNLRLQEPIVMDSTVTDNLQAPRFATARPFLVAGLGERYTWE